MGLWQSKNFITSVTLVLGLGVVAACSEQPAAERRVSPGGGSSGGGGDTDGGEFGGDVGGGSGDDSGPQGEPTVYNLCDAITESDKLASYSSIVEELCSNGGLEDLRKAENIYDGRRPKLLGEEVSSTGSSTTMQYKTSTVANAKAKDYFDMIRLQITKPKDFKGDACDQADPYKTDCDADLDVLRANATGATFIYTNEGDGQGGRVNYKAAASFITLKADQAYLIGSQSDNQHSYEGLSNFNGLIIINKESELKTEVISFSNQTFAHANSNEKDSILQAAETSLEDDQERSYKNAEKADQAADKL